MLAITMTDDDWFLEIEIEERKKRRGGASSNAESTFGFDLSGFFQDLKDGFSLPRGAFLKYAR